MAWTFIDHYITIAGMTNNTIYSNIPNLSILHSHIECLLTTTSASVYWKDKNGLYLGVNHQFLQTSNMQSCNDAIGKTDRDLLWSEQAHAMMNHDQEIIYTRQTKTYLESARSPKNGIISYLSYKTPLRSRNGKTIGVFGLSFAVHDENSIANALNETAIQINKQMNSGKPDSHLIFNNASNQLSKQQINCLYYLVRGFTIKQIAAQLDLSNRTVEHYLNNIKNKLNCRTRAELIDKALKLDVIKNQL